MKQSIHPKMHDVTIRCACGNSFPSVSTQTSIEIDICSGCHPLFTGQQKFVDTAGRIEKFQARYAKSGAALAAAAPAAAKAKPAAKAAAKAETKSDVKADAATEAVVAKKKKK